MPPSLHNEGLAGGPPKFYTFAETPSGALLVGSCVRGISRSRDGGSTWEPVGGMDDISINTLAVDSDGALLAATSGGLWRSVDDAATWTRVSHEALYAVLPDGVDRPPAVTTMRLVQLRDGRKLAGTDGDGVWVKNGEWKLAGLNDTIVYSLLETSSGTLLAGTRGQGISRSEDGGRSWTPSSTSLPDAIVHFLIQLRDGSILAGTGQGLSLSNDDGRSWKPYASELHGHRMFAAYELTDGRVLAGSYSHMWVGKDEAWRQVDPGMTPDESWAVLFGDNGAIYGGGKKGVLRSDNRGETWSCVAPGNVVFTLTNTADGNVLAGGTAGVWRSPDWHAVGTVGPRVYALFEVAPNHLLAGTLTEGLYQYVGEKWGPVVDGPPDWQIYQIIRSSTGRLLACSGTIVDGEKLGSVYVSDNDARTWTPTLSGRSYYKMTQTTDGAVYAGGRRCYITKSTDDGAIYAGGRRCYIAKSTDDGSTWEECPLPFGQESKMYSLTSDRAGRLFLGAGGQLLRSDDGARTWTLLDKGIDGVSVYDLREGADGILAAATSVGMFVSDDGGDSWRGGSQ